MRLRRAAQNGRAFVQEAAQTRGRYFSFLREVREESEKVFWRGWGHRPPNPPTLHPLAQLPGRALRKIRLREDPPHRGAGARGEAGSKSGPSLVGERAFRHES